ncbi:MAG: glutathionylspermidine synthase family protein [Bacilli bacterium]
MKRLPIAARKNWKENVEIEHGVMWSTTENGPYWNEAMEQPVYYSLTQTEQEALEHAGNTIHCIALESITWLLEIAPTAVRNKWFDLFFIPEEARQHIIDSWEDDEWAVYGRFDFVMQDGVPKLLEYNADTPTTLIETGLTQWQWFFENQQSGVFPPSTFQFNDLHDSLIRHWKDLHSKYNKVPNKVHFAAFDQVDDFSTVCYMADLAAQAGIDAVTIPMDQIGWNGVEFTDPDENKIDACFKLYPWEWMFDDAFGEHICKSDTQWIEPSWKMLLSNKALLALLWERHPHCENLVPAFVGETAVTWAESGELQGKWVHKPLLSREGSNILIIDYNNMTEVASSQGEYDDGGWVVQKYIEWEPIDGKYPMLGVWMVGEDAVALGIREDDTCITQNNSRFIPHVVEKD